MRSSGRWGSRQIQRQIRVHIIRQRRLFQISTYVPSEVQDRYLSDVSVSVNFQEP